MLTNPPIRLRSLWQRSPELWMAPASALGIASSAVPLLQLQNQTSRTKEVLSEWTISLEGYSGSHGSEHCSSLGHSSEKKHAPPLNLNR